MNPYVLTGPEVRTLKSELTGRACSAIVARGMVFVPWKASPEELEEIANGRPIWVVLRGEHIPEFHVQAGEQKAVIPPDIRFKAARESQLLASPKAKELRQQNKRDEKLSMAFAVLYGCVLVAALVSSLFLLTKALL